MLYCTYILYPAGVTIDTGFVSSLINIITVHLSVHRLWNPVGMFTGGAVIALVVMGSVWAGENKAMIKNFKRDNPTLFFFLVLVVSYLLMSLFGGVMVFMLGIKLPLLCKSMKKYHHTVHQSVFLVNENLLEIM